MKSRWLLLFLSLTLAVTAHAEQSGLGRHKRIFIVPRPRGGVTIDGKFDDWDLSGQIWMYVAQETSEMQSAKFALMYDADALYVAGEVRDPTPLMNRHDPLVEPENAWDADVCQFRIVLDAAQGYPVKEEIADHKANDQMAHLTLWYYTDRQEPCLQVKYGMNYASPKAGYPGGVMPHDKYQAAYRKAADPSTASTGSGQAGSGQAGNGYTFEYRIPWKTLEAKTPPRAGDYVAATVQFNFSRPDGLRTNGGWAYDVMGGPGFTFQSSACWGKAIFSEKGNLPRELVEDGIAPTPRLPLTFHYTLPEDGDTTLQLYDASGQMVRLLVAQGARRAGNLIEKWDGLNDAGMPFPAGQYTWRGLYHQPLQIKYITSVHNSGQPAYKTDDNTGGWGGDHGTPQAACAVSDAVVLSWNACEAGWGLIRTDLAGKKKWGGIYNATELATDGTRIYAYDDYYKLHVHALVDSQPVKFNASTNTVNGLAFGHGALYIAHKADNTIELCDPVTGAQRAIWNVPAPERLAVRADGSALVISRGKVLEGRGARAEGNDTVAWRELITDHLDAPVSIALDGAGNVYVANRGALQNVSVFSPAGSYQRSIGKPGGRPAMGDYDKTGMLSAGGIAVDQSGQLWVAETLDSPKRVSVWDTKTGQFIREFFGGSSYSTWVSADSHRPDEFYCHGVLWKVDLDKGTTEPVSTLWRPTAPNMLDLGNASHFRVMTARNGKQYGWGMVNLGTILYLREGNVFKPVAGLVNLHSWYWKRDGQFPAFSDHKQFPDDGYLWQDTNHDQIVQGSELVRSPSGRIEPIFNWIDADLNAWCDLGMLFRPVRIEPDGRPVYDFAKSEPIPIAFKGLNSNFTSLWLDDQDDTVYTLAPGEDEALVHWNRDGKKLWSFRGGVTWHASIGLPPVPPGKFWGPTMPLGVAGEITGVAMYFGSFQLVTRDGLFVSMIMRDGRTIGGPPYERIVCENFAGQLLYVPGSQRYFLLAGDQDGRINEILGINTIKRLSGGPYTLTEADVKEAAAAHLEYEQLKQKAQPLFIARGKGSLDSVRGVTQRLDDGRGFEAKLAYDAQNLYVGYDVDSSSELVNGIADPHVIFKGGNLLDLQLTTATGAQRVLITRHGVTPVAVLFRPQGKGSTGQPIVLKSPTGQELFDSIEVLPSVSVAYTKTASGFKALATIPLSALGLKLTPGASVKLDLGYIYGNVTGTQTALRSYWSNHGFSAGVVNDVPNESRLEPKLWGTATVE